MFLHVPQTYHYDRTPEGRIQSSTEEKARGLRLHIKWSGTCGMTYYILRNQKASWLGSRASFYNLQSGPLWPCFCQLGLLSQRIHTSYPQRVPPAGEKVFKQINLGYISHLNCKSHLPHCEQCTERSVPTTFNWYHTSAHEVLSFQEPQRLQCCHFQFNKPGWCVDRHGHGQNSRQLSKWTYTGVHLFKTEK